MHRKIARARADYLHKESCQIAERSRVIVVGDVLSVQLVKTDLAKSERDAGWSSFKEMPRYKATARGASFVCVAEHNNTTRMCPCCRVIPVNTPKGLGALGIREWTCSSCDTDHDRDVNLARNILRCGLAALEEGAQA